jgi:hypothetical protein
MLRRESAALLAPGAGANDDWREVGFCAGTTWGAASDSVEGLFVLLGRLLAGERPSGPASMTFTGAPAAYNRAGSVPRAFESQLRAEGGAERLLVLKLAETPNVRSFASHLLTKLLAERPAREADLIPFAVERMRRLNVGLLMIEGADNIMRCRHDERGQLLDMFGRIATGLGVHVVGAGDSINASFIATEAPVSFLKVALATPGARTILQCLTER